MTQEYQGLLVEFGESDYDSMARLVIENYPDKLGLLTDVDTWPSIKFFDPNENAVHVDIVSTDVELWEQNIIERYAIEMGQSAQFPVNTAMLHGMGCVSAAISRTFTYSIYGDKTEPCNLFCVTAQPPSTGKSGIHSNWMEPIRIAIMSLNKERAKLKAKAEDRIKSAKDELKSAPESAKDILFQEIAVEAERANNLGPLSIGLDDVTPEALEQKMSQQSGWANIVSDEADAVNTMLGFSYGDNASKKTNYGVFLKMFSGEWHSSSRITRDGFEGHIMGSFAVLAQAEAIEQILLAGKSGRGVSERILLMREQHYLGTRDMTKFTPVKGAIKSEYINTINNIVNSSPTNLTLTKEAFHEIAIYRNQIEQQMGDDGIYSDNMTRGAMGKADKQICKIASILWVSTEWSQNGKKRTEIGRKTVMRAIEIFKELSRTYLQETESRGYSGYAAKVNSVRDYLKGKLLRDLKETKAQKTYPFITLETISNSIRSRKEFAGSKPNKVLKEVVLPKLESEGYVIRKRNKIYISKKILD